MAEALAYAHAQGILHRDVKPSNLLLDGQGHVWVTDFGLAKVFEGEDGLTRTGEVVGTVRYMAPERFDGRSEPRSDVYALGVTFYELLTLRPLFAESNRATDRASRASEPVRPRQLDRRIPRDLETIVLKATAKEPTAVRTAAALAEDLRRYLDGEPLLARRTSGTERAWRWARRNRLVASLLALLGLVLLGGFAGMATLWVRAEYNAGVARHHAEIARQNEDRALRQAGIAGQRAEDLRRQDYINRVNLAYRECLANNVTQALELLEGCPEDLRAWEWSYVHRQCHLELHTFRESARAVNAVAFSPDGRRVASGSGSYFDNEGTGDLVVRDAASGREVFAHRGLPGGLRAVAFSPDGRGGHGPRRR